MPALRWRGFHWRATTQQKAVVQTVAKGVPFDPINQRPFYDVYYLHPQFRVACLVFVIPHAAQTATIASRLLAMSSLVNVRSGHFCDPQFSPVNVCLSSSCEVDHQLMPDLHKADGQRFISYACFRPSAAVHS